MKGLTFFTFMVSEKNPNVNVFDKPRQMTNQKMLFISLEYTPESLKSYCTWSLLMYVAIIQRLSLQSTGIQNTQYAVYISDTPVTLEQGQGHQT